MAEKTVGTKVRWGMVIDLSKCMRCHGCVVACRAEHFLPLGMLWCRLIAWEESADEMTTYPVRCNHCKDPPCVYVCPTGASQKREEDGIVWIDQDMCVGCRYCVVGCPYGSRSFNWVDPRPFIKEYNLVVPTRMRGVVEKCNFCEDRLANGQGLACVEACPERALTFGDLDESGSELTERLRGEYTLRRKPALGTNPKVYYIL